MVDRKWLLTLGIGVATAAIAIAMGSAWARSASVDPAALAAKEAGASELAPSAWELGDRAKEAGVFELGKKDGGFTELAAEGGGGGWRETR